MTGFFAFALAIQRPSQVGVAWGEPIAGLSLGIEETTFPDGPPLFQTWLHNKTGEPIVYCTGDSMNGPAVPLLEFRETFRRHLPPFVFTVTPPRGHDGAGTPDLGVLTYIQIEPKQTMPLYAARFWIPGKPGHYAVRATFVQPEQDALDWHPTFRKGRLTLHSGTRYVTIRPSDCLPSQGG